MGRHPRAPEVTGRRRFQRIAAAIYREDCARWAKEDFAKKPYHADSHKRSFVRAAVRHPETSGVKVVAIGDLV